MTGYLAAGGRRGCIGSRVCPAGLVRVVDRPYDPVDMHLELTPVRVGQLAERILVASACAREDLVGHARILAPIVPFTRITVMTSARPEIRRSISLAANASTHATPTSPSKENQDGKDRG